MENNNLKTMEQKLQEDPNEIMENGLTRAQNQKIEKDGETFGGMVSLIGGIIALMALLQML